MDMFVRGPHGEMLMRPGFGPPPGGADMRGGMRPGTHAQQQYAAMAGFPPRGFPPQHQQRVPRSPMEMQQQVRTIAIVYSCITFTM